MQSTQSKLLLSALVAAQTVTALEIKETGLTESAPNNQITLAQTLTQVEDGAADGIDSSDQAPGNDNSDDVHNDTPSSNSALESSALDDKIDLLTQSQMAGLAAKEAYMDQKVKFLANEKFQQFCDLEETCREKGHAQKEESKRILDEGFAAGLVAAKKCRTDFVDAQLVKKEIVKGNLEELLNIAIQEIKELKVEGIFADSGIPTDQHKSAIDTEIAGIVTAFETASDLLLTNATDSDGFMDTLMVDLAAFKDTGATSATETACLNVVRYDFDFVFNGDGAATTQTDATRGEKAIYDAAHELCLTKMSELQTEADADIAAKILTYTDDAGKQENKARETFMRLIESSMIKLHGLTDLTALERIDLKEAIIDKRDDYAKEVMGWSVKLATTLGLYKDGEKVEDVASSDLVDES